MRILLFHHDIVLAKPLQACLSKNKYIVDFAKNIKDTLAYIAKREFDAIILDYATNKLDLTRIIKEIRKTNITIPIALLINESEKDSCTSYFDEDIDGYIKKTDTEAQVLSTMRFLTRHERVSFQSNITVGNVTFNKATYKLSTSFGSCSLSQKEFQLLEILFERPGKYTPTETLKSKVWDKGAKAESSGVWTYFSYIRKKLNDINANITIKSTRHLGYTLQVI